MLKKIQDFLRERPGLKAKTLANHLDSDRRYVNKVLYSHPKIFFQDAEFNWFSVPQGVLRIELSGPGWLTAADFENALLKAGSPLDSDCATVTFVVVNECKILLEALARLLALCNQLVNVAKKVSLDFRDCKSTLSYLGRMEFFGHLNAAINVLPKRPSSAKTVAYVGNNEGVVEFRAIDPSAPNQKIPDLLLHSFVRCAGEHYSVGAFTVLSELFRNVQEHSAASTVGFAGLQFYKRTNHIQTVISDSGLGIVGTLTPILMERYPKVARRISASSLDPGVALLIEVFSAGGISKVEDDGRGLGLKRSGELAQKFKAKISVRQENFELRVHHSPAGIHFSHSLNLVRIAGTHICFDLKLD